jgi:hypothetical protein
MKLKIFCGAFVLLMFNVVTGFAQISCACACNDVDSTPCPLDSSVVVLAAIGLVFGGVHLYRKGKHRPSEI